MNDWRRLIEEEWNRIHPNSPPAPLFPLMNLGFGASDIIAAIDSLLSGQITMRDRVREFEQRFSDAVGVKYAVMVNSGSSANLLAVSAASNPQRDRHLRRGDEVLVPAVCWSTSVWPLIQNGLQPVFVDVDPETLNLSIDDLRSRASSRARGLIIVHVLGNSCPMNELMSFAEERELILIEDTCESLGATAAARSLGSFGDFGTFSFYYSHHITTGEGGVVVCSRDEDVDLLRCLRAHGWTRELSNRSEVEKRHADIDPRFLFVNLGYNVRPLEVQAALGMSQLDRLAAMNRARNMNRERLIAALESHREWRGQFAFPHPGKGTQPAWFGFMVMIRNGRDRVSLLHALSARGVENRPIISGNFARQPALKLFGIEIDPRDYPGAEAVHERGFFIGLHSEPLSDETVKRLADILLTS